MNSQVAENNPIKVVDTLSDKSIVWQPMKRKAKTTSQDAKITFIASPADQQIIAAGIEKHGLRKMSEVIRMALRRYAEAEGWEVKAS